MTRSSARVAAACALGVGLLAFLVAAARMGSAGLGLDYGSDAAGSIGALAHGDLRSFAESQPAMGSFTLLLRAPLAALVPRSGVDTAYVIGLLPCLLVVGLVARELRREAIRRHGPGLAADLLPALLLLGTPTLEALIFGHPEEPVGAALCVGAALAAIRRRPLLAGALLGLAIATKQWGAFAVAPIILAGTGGRVRTAATAGVVAAVLTLPLALEAPGRFAAVGHQVLGAGSPPLSTLSLWSPLAHSAGTGGYAGFPVRLVDPGFAQALSRPAMAVWMAILLVGFACFRGRRREEDVLGLLALVFLGRCLLDPVDNVYYHAPFLMSLVAWEGLRSGALPRISLAVSALLGAVALAGRLGPPSPALYELLYLPGLLLAGALIVRGLSGRWTSPPAERLQAAPAASWTARGQLEAG